MSDLSPRERGLLVALRAEDEPTRDDRARVRAALAAKIALTGGAVGLSAAAAKTASATTGAGSFAALFSWKVGVAVVALTAAGAGGASLMSGSEEGRSAPVAPAMTEAVAQVAAVPSPAAEAAASAAASSDTAAEPPPTPPPSAAVERSPASAPARAATSSPDDAAREEKELQAELALLTEAQRALKQGDSNGALSALDRHAAEHPQGTLAIERAGVRAIALCESGKVAAGQAAAKRFLAQNPKSVLAARIRGACF